MGWRGEACAASRCAILQPRPTRHDGQHMLKATPRQAPPHPCGGSRAPPKLGGRRAAPRGAYLDCVDCVRSESAPLCCDLGVPESAESVPPSSSYV
jgi:hypothetical protein